MSEINYKKEILLLEDLVNREFSSFSNKIKKTIKNDHVYYKQLQNRLRFVEWMNKKFDLSFEGMPNQVFQREIFYCHLGNNLGSEQGNHRPVVILQNNIGNNFGNTTIIAPITTYKNSTFTKSGKVWYIEYDKNGEIIKRKLDFYEVPIELEQNPVQKIVGIANVVHMREVSKKRLSKTPVAKVTIDNFNELRKAVTKNLDLL
ncbi:MAG: type II toxin-antitoxin system PemK/MazF family toxin [Eubacteriales bacterium]